MPKLDDGSRPDQDLSTYQDLTDEELDAILKGKKEDPTQVEEPDDEPDNEPEEEPDAEDEPQDDEPEGEDEAEEEDSEDGDPEPDEAEEDVFEKRLALLERRLEIESMKRQKAEEDAKRASLLASKQAGRAGYLQQQLKKTAPKPTEDGEDAEGDWDDTDESRPATGSEDRAPQNPVWDEDRAEQVMMILRDEGMSFANQHISDIETMVAGDNDVSVESFDKRLQEIITEEVQRNREDFQSASLKTVRKLARSIMNSAYATARIEYAEEASEKATVRQAESTGKRIRRKKKAAISKSGKAPKRAAPVQKSYEEMSDEEIENEFKKEFGTNYRGSRNIISRR
jgi:hypothetical protein